MTLDRHPPSVLTSDNVRTGPFAPAPSAAPPPTLLATTVDEAAAVEWRAVLRRRLLVLSGLYGIILIYLYVLPGLLNVELGHHHVYGMPGLVSGGTATVSTVGTGGTLMRRRLPSLRGLRLVELLLHGGILLFLARWAYDEIARLHSHPLWGHELEDTLIRSSAYACSINGFIVLIVYGLLVPNSGARCAVVCLATALVLLLVYVAAVPPGRADLLVKLTTGSATTFSLAIGLAVFGSYKISSLQREVKLVRQRIRALGQYHLKRRLGGGGMGEVYLAEHALLKRPCAIKFLRPDMTVHPGALARFEREVRATARLTHPNVVEIYDYGRAEDGTFYYAMEYLPGLDLQQLIARAGPLPAGRVVYLLRQVTAALREAHALGLIHRDIKPSNILVTPRGGDADFVKLLDFGLVREHDALGGPLTQTGLILGTPGFMSPEQAAGETAIDARSDLYSMGAVAYFLLGGRAPFAGRPLAKLIAAHVLESPTPPTELRRDVPEDLAAIVSRCLAREAAERFPDAVELERAFQDCDCATNWSKEHATAWWRAQPPPA